MNIHEYQGKDVLKRYGVAVLDGYVATTPEEAEAGAAKLPGPIYVVKSQIHAGGRGAGDAGAHRDADDARRIVRVADAVRHLREELVGLRVELEDRGAVGVEQVAEGVDHRGQDRLQVTGGGEPPRKLDELLGARGFRPALVHQPFGSLAAGAAIWPPFACG